MLIIAVSMVALLAAITVNTSRRHFKYELLLNPGEASGADKDPDDPWDLSHPRCRGISIDLEIIRYLHCKMK